jgi:hypothetical protein
MWITVSTDKGEVLHTAHIPDPGTPAADAVPVSDREWQERIEQAQRFHGQAPVSEHPIRPTDHDVLPTSPPAPQERGDRTFAWNPTATEVFAAIVPCPGARYALDADAGPCPEIGPHTHYADGSVRAHFVRGG